MKRILLILSIFTISFYSEAQKYQDALLYGENKNRLDVFYLLGIPNDTFAIPSFPQDKRRKPHIAAKGNTMYLWDTTAYRWNPITAGVGGSGDGIASLGNSGNLWLLRPNDSTYAVDTATANTFYRTLFPQLSGSYANPSWISSLAWSKITGAPSWQPIRFDSSYTPLGGNRGSEYIVKSVRIRRNNITVTPTQIGDSAMYWNIDVPDTASLSDRINLKLNISDTANIKPRLYAGSNITITGTYPNLTIAASGGGGTNNANIGSGYRWLNPGTQELRTLFAGLYTTIDSSSNTNGLTVKVDTASMFPALRATIPSGGGGAPSGNFGNIPVIRNGALVVPGSDSLDFDAGLIIKGILSASALPTGGVDADSIVVINSSGAFKKRNVSAFARMNTTSAANQLALFNGNGTLYSSSKFVFSDATYPSMSIVGSDPLMYFGGTGAAYPSIGKSGNSIAIYGPSTGKSIGFYDQLVGGKQMLRLYTTSGSVATFSKTAITLDTAVGGPSIGSVHVEYNAGDSTSAGTDVGRHMFRGIGRTYANAGSFNTFYSTVEAGNTTYSQDHIISWQSDAKKTGANTLNIIYHLGILGDSIKAGTVNNRWGVYMYDAKVTAGATLAHQSALRVPKLASAVRNYDMFSDSAQTVKMDGNLLIGDSSLATGARKTIHLFNGTAPSSNISGSILYSESGEFKIRNGSGAINTLSGNAVFSGTIKTADPGSGAGAFKFGTAVTSSGLVLKTTQYVEISIDGTVYRLALVDPPTPQP